MHYMSILGILMCIMIDGFIHSVLKTEKIGMNERGVEVGVKLFFACFCG